MSVRFEQDLGIGMAGKAYAFVFELRANLAKVVDLAVVDDPVSGRRVLHWLVAMRRQIENGEPPIAKSNLVEFRATGSKNDSTGIDGAAMRKRVSRGLQ